MPTIKDHIAVVKAEIDATGKRLETETLSADQLVEVGQRMSEPSTTLNWLNHVDAYNSRISKPNIKIVN